MDKIIYRTKKKGKSNIVWLQKSNKYINLKNPAFDIFQLLADKTKKEMICRFLSDKYGFTIQYCHKIVADFKLEIKRINVPDAEEKELPAALECSNRHFEPCSTYSYRFGEKTFSISFEDKFPENWLHPILRHLHIEKTEDVAFHFEVFSCEGNIVFREKYSENNSTYPADKIFQILSNKLFGKSDNDWLIKVHASAITNRRKTILFSGPSGSGKTTLAALLLQKGYDLVSDDLVLIDKTIRAFGFPSAMSVKKGSVQKLSSIYPELAGKPEIQVSPEKKVRYLNTNMGKTATNDVYPVNQVVFVKYSAGTDFKFKKLSWTLGIQAFLKQAYITPEPNCAEIFLEWAVKASFYDLTYSDSVIAMDAIIKVFENEV